MRTSIQAFVAVVIGVSVCIGEARSQEATAATKPASKPAEAVDPTGTWKWQYTFNDNTADFKLKLKWDGKRVTGQYTAFDNTTEIEDAKLDKDQLSFIAKREFNGNAFEVDFEGQVKADDIVGTVTVDFGDEPREFDWNAKRAVEIDDVVGVWDLRLETPDGVITPKLTITKDKDGKLSGQSVSVMGTREAQNMTLKENQLRWEIVGDDTGRQFKIVYTGKPRGNQIEGASEFDFDGQTGTMKFTGKRTPASEKAGERTAPPQRTEDSAAEAGDDSAAEASDAEPATTVE